MTGSHRSKLESLRSAASFVAGKAPMQVDYYRSRARSLRAAQAGRTFGCLIASLSEHTDRALKVLGTISAAYTSPRP